MKKLRFTAFLGIILYHQKNAKESADEAHKQNIMVNGACPKEFVPSPVVAQKYMNVFKQCLGI
jgi:hypothetical protein|tara:strand:+ start:278 stop:466 length:189 start_codon:yes stop_codon:yes gene_type:complete